MDENNTKFNWQKWKQDFKEFMWVYGPEWLILGLLALASLFLFTYAVPPAWTFSPIDPQITNPLVPEALSGTAAGLMCVFIPLGCMIVCQIWIRDLHDFHHAVLGLLQAVALTSATCALYWATIGTLRPSFVAGCNPDIPAGTQLGHPVQYFPLSVCKTSPAALNFFRKAFPSGHSATALAPYLFLTLYLNAKLKVLPFQYGNIWRVVVIFAPLILGYWIGFTRWRDYNHAIEQVVLGSLLGSLYAALIYKLHFYSVFHKRNNIARVYYTSKEMRDSKDSKQRKHQQAKDAPLQQVLVDAEQQPEQQQAVASTSANASANEKDAMHLEPLIATVCPHYATQAHIL